MRIYVNIPGASHLCRVVGGEERRGKKALFSCESPAALCNDKKNVILN